VQAAAADCRMIIVGSIPGNTNTLHSDTMCMLLLLLLTSG
jgi:hypothetical protein